MTTLIESTPPEGARKALIEAALSLFGESGYSATSTRALAAKAGVNISLIAYHFGGKAGLRLACGQEIARRMKGAAELPKQEGPLTSTVARLRLTLLVRSLVQFLCTDPEAENIFGFLLHEIIGGGDVHDMIYEHFISPKHSELAALWAAASGGDANNERVKLSVFAMIGQIAYFRLARQIVARRMGWDSIGPEEATRIADLLIANLETLLSAGKAP